MNSQGYRKFREGIGFASQFLGAFILIGGLFPLINPGLHAASGGKAGLEFGGIVQIAFGVWLIAGGKYVQWRASKMKDAEKQPVERKVDKIATAIFLGVTGAWVSYMLLAILLGW